MNKLKYLAISIIVLVMSLSLAGPSMDVSAKPQALGVSPILTGLANYSILGGAAVTNVPTTTTNGAVGVSPGVAMGGGFVAGGGIHINDASAIAAQADALVAYNNLVAQGCDVSLPTGTDLSITDVGFGVGVYPPGVYCSAGSFFINTTINLSGSTGVWIFKTVSTLIALPGATVTGGDPCNTWWQVGSSTTLGTNSSFMGTVISQNGVNAMQTGATLNGRFIGLTAATVTMDQNTINLLCRANMTTTASGPVVVGGAITDTATLTNVSGLGAGGTISFNVYAPGDTTCAAPIAVGPAVAVTGAGSYTSANYTSLVVGVYRWRAFYSGDANNAAVSTPCNDPGEYSTVTAALPPAPVVLPSTGFAPRQVTVLPAQSAEKAYAALGDLWLEIPKLGVQMSIVGVPQSNGTWDVSWLGNNAGWLQGTAFPTWSGNSVITGHVWNANNKAGPFVYLNTLWYGDRIIVHAWGQQYIYEVRSVMLVRPESVTAAFQHKDAPWLTLTTCRSYDIEKGTYRYRVLVQAVQVQIK